MNYSQVACFLGFDVTEPAEVVLQISVAAPEKSELTVSAGEVSVLPDGQRMLRAPAGRVEVSYEASVGLHPGVPAVTEVERIVALRPSRYCPSDRLGGFASKEFGGLSDATTAVRAITSWVYGHLAYTPGSSGPTTDAIDTLLGGAGVCRDYAHLVATLCRAIDIPARVAAVYAPGLDPMDFHLVVETALEGQWRVWDATRLAPRQSLMRIATGRDAADTALATTISGALTMPDIRILAVAGGDLPYDDHEGLVSLS
ncbi:transglutaminase family protein [Actinoplanes bogorensis]|uniref:Transglutaminase family protein n=1 Tax=Paractinoplanes bogorensis TaxID=1610840 RepID=A0ABS5YT06_9ACTN|nr:transglutaminase family protein [Actinoplanes bogorensis]MBU2666584.1 transglutaminase family protein [Actinoplanes bogorensis]